MGEHYVETGRGWMYEVGNHVRKTNTQGLYACAAPGENCSWPSPAIF